jgi:hypothetical protein
MDSYNEVGSKGIAAGVLREENRLIWQEVAYITKRTSRCSCFCWTHFGACDHRSKCRLPQTKSMWLTFIDSTIHSFTITLACHINSLCWNQGKLPLSSIPKMLRWPYICKRMFFSQVKRSMQNNDLQNVQFATLAIPGIISINVATHNAYIFDDKPHSLTFLLTMRNYSLSSRSTETRHQFLTVVASIILVLEK